MKFTEILDRFRIPYLTEGHEHCTAGWVQLDCPQCSRDSGRYRLGYNLAGGYCSCWYCGGVPLVRVVAELTHLSYQQVRKLLGEVEKEQHTKREASGKLILPAGVGPLLPAHRRYLRKRGFDPTTLERLWRLQGIGVSSQLAWRIFIPIFFQGRMVSWTTRSIGESHDKRYRSAKPEQEVIHHKTLLYGEDYARHAVIVVEGPTGCWRIGPGTVGTLGTGYSRAQMLRISRYPVRVICFDPEPQAQERARRLCDELMVLPGETYNVTLDDHDPGEATDEEVAYLRTTFLGDVSYV